MQPLGGPRDSPRRLCRGVRLAAAAPAPSLAGRVWSCPALAWTKDFSLRRAESRPPSRPVSGLAASGARRPLHPGLGTESGGISSSTLMVSMRSAVRGREKR